MGLKLAEIRRRFNSFSLLGEYTKCLFLVSVVDCDILVRIHIRGSVPRNNGSGSCYFCQTFKMATNKFFSKFFCLLFLILHYIIFQRWKVIKKSQSSRNQDFFILLLLDDRRICIGAYFTLTDPDPDPDSQHFFLELDIKSYLNLLK